MKPKSKAKTKKRARQSSIVHLGQSLQPRLVLRKGSRFFTKLVEATGIPEGYSSTVAWFAERMILAGVCIAVASFAGGVIFTLYLSGPIADSQPYNVLVAKAQQVREQIIDLASPILSGLIRDNRQNDLEQLAQAQLAEQKVKLKNYLITKNSPFALDDDALSALVASKNMKLILAISFVESTFGQHCYYYNCSGIGGAAPNLRKYKNYTAWIQDFDNLLEDRYKGLPPEKFMGLYVQPGSPNWLYGVKQVLQEFIDLGIG